jgi:hypothetical protein
MGANTDFYSVGNNRVGGTVGSIVVDPDGLNSHWRRVHNNIFASAADNGYATITPISLDGAGNYANTTPFVKSISISGGTGFDEVSINGVRVWYQAAPCTVMIEPGDTLHTNAFDAAIIARTMA